MLQLNYFPINLNILEQGKYALSVLHVNFAFSFLCYPISNMTCKFLFPLINFMFHLTRLTFYISVADFISWSVYSFWFILQLSTYVKCKCQQYNQSLLLLFEFENN